MKLPTHAECLTLLDQYRTPRHVVQHCLMVDRVALFLAKRLKKYGSTIDVETVDRAALLHDILRVVNFEGFDPKHFAQTISKEDLALWRAQKTLYSGVHHATAAKHELTKLGFKTLGTIVEAHRADAINGKVAKLDSLEKKVLYYSDKRVAHTEIVSVAQRFAEWGKRHEWNAQKLKEVAVEKKKVLELEQELMELSHMKPRGLKEAVLLH